MTKKKPRKKTPTTTTIRAFGEIWHVPRGFGRVYRDVVRDQERHAARGAPGRMLLDVISALEVTGYTSTVHVVAEWSARQRVEALIWAATEYARAGDNPVQRHPRPTWITVQPWKGPEVGEGIWRSPSPTPIEREA
jgi:hypothetical protein